MTHIISIHKYNQQTELLGQRSVQQACQGFEDKFSEMTKLAWMKKEIKYTNGELTIVWRPHLCQHSGNCFTGLPEVFKPMDRPWVDVDGASTKEMEDQVHRCPSGALTCYYNDKPDQS